MFRSLSEEVVPHAAVDLLCPCEEASSGTSCAEPSPQLILLIESQRAARVTLT